MTSFYVSHSTDKLSNSTNPWAFGLQVCREQTDIQDVEMTWEKAAALR